MTDVFGEGHKIFIDELKKLKDIDPKLVIVAELLSLRITSLERAEDRLTNAVSGIFESLTK